MTDLLSNDDLFSLTESVWQNILGLELSRDINDDGKIDDRAVISSVQITGDWEGAVTVACSRPHAMELAAAMFQMESTDIDDEMMRDAMGEIANMTGGSVKGIAPGTNTLTLPTVAEGAEDSMSITGTVQLNRISATCLQNTVVVNVFGKE